jgi:hypothetical protein
VSGGGMNHYIVAEMMKRVGGQMIPPQLVCWQMIIITDFTSRTAREVTNKSAKHSQYR